MGISALRATVTEVTTPLLAVGIFEGDPTPIGDAGTVDAALGGLIRQLIADKEVTGEPNEVTVVHTQGKLPATRIAVVGLGKRADFNIDIVRQASATVALKARGLHVPRYAVMLLGLGQAGVTAEQSAVALSEGAFLGLYEYEQFKKPTEETPTKIEEIVLVASDQADVDAAQRGVHCGEVAARGVNLARDLSNGPPNLVTPAYLADTARSIAQRLGFSCEVFEVDALRKRNMGGIVAVGQGSSHPPCLIVMRYSGGAPGSKTFAAVGKGITFDSGGLDIKPADGMLTMKHDMSGAAAVIGFMQAAAELKLPINILGLASAAENLPSGTAYRPSDIITAFNGKTIEVSNTDAEGRLVLSDALAYAVDQGASAIVDLATLTGGCIVALGTVASGILGNNDSLIETVRQAAEATGERVWQLPLWKEYAEQLKSDIADTKSSGARQASAITAAYFLSNFVDDVPWVHVDIAGTAYYGADQVYYPKDRPYLPSGATGVGVRLLLSIVERWAKSP